LLEQEASLGDNLAEKEVVRIAKEMSQALLLQLQAGDEQREVALNKFERMSFDGEESSRAAQFALQEASVKDAADLAARLHGQVRKAAESKYANYVVQEIMAVVPVAKASFIVEELLGCGEDAAKHRFACRIVCRILEHESPGDEAAAQLIEEILAAAQTMCSHAFGSFVIRHILEFGLPEHRHKIASALSVDAIGYARTKHGSHVVEAALRFCALNDQRILVASLIEKKDQLLSVASNQYGRHVVKALLSARALPSELREAVKDSLRPFSSQLQSSRYGKSVLNNLHAASS
jgi:hypothetical protein